MKQPTQTIVIAGINGDLGQAYLREVVTLPQTKVYGIGRSPARTSNYTHLQADLLDTKHVAHLFTQIQPTDHLIWIHLVGKFRFEDAYHPIADNDGDGIDDSIYATNLTTFTTVAPHLATLLARNPRMKLTVIGIGSALDMYRLPFWRSFTLAKDALRKEFRALYGNPAQYGRVRTLFVNVSTVAGTQLQFERPFKDPEYCLNPQEVVMQSLPFVLDPASACIELNVIKPHPSFTQSDFLQESRVRKRWYRDMYRGKKLVHFLKKL